jgi:hypothetical protein
MKIKNTKAFCHWYLKSKGLAETKKKPRYKPFRGGTYGPAGACKKMSPSEVARIENEMREQGRL